MAMFFHLHVLVEGSSPSLDKISLSASSIYRSKRILHRPCGDVFTVLGEVFAVCEPPLPVEEDPSSSLWRCLHRPWRSFHCLRAASTGRRGSSFVPVEMSSPSLEKSSLSVSPLYRPKMILHRPFGDVFTVLGEVLGVCEPPLPAEEYPLWYLESLHSP